MNYNTFHKGTLIYRLDVHLVIRLTLSASVRAVLTKHPYFSQVYAQVGKLKY